MIGKGTKLYSILRMKCPRCHEGDFFEGHPYNLSTMGKVKSHCPKCDVKYSIEPSFYQGSYYVVYSLGVALFIGIWVLKAILFPEAGPGILLLSIFGSLVLLSPLLYALSKIIWANLFFTYEKEITNKKIVNSQND
ncbi:DUF983 domain-containing protein [Aquimarina sp. AD10]|uniref:DUF983 domain-containing protein n=1 Tax=Aquimarina aggregata TaxID=1642818 RepID=A0A163CJS8_9FLAO|nr:MULTISPECIES: DUF983 domain-containing protein [Aquimarina]AXT59512.1 DUF983 domain-containing protein [Aquimarina sp. AD10]KZS42491.1 hypothetical protein AWE51_03345 [Aquimarina aggregata]RKN00413.1 DUF983 domain-containing protein [Aquimarina sp. AD10]